jgi:hypothetical protein
MLNFFKKLFGNSSANQENANSSNSNSFDETFEANKGKVIDFSKLSEDEQKLLQGQIAQAFANQPADETITKELLTFKLKQIEDSQDASGLPIIESDTATLQRIGLDIGMFLCKDSKNFVQILSSKHIAHLNISAEEALDIAMKNFWAQYAPAIEIHESKWEDVYMLICGDGLEANFFVMGHLALGLKEQIKSDTLEIILPFCDTFFFSPKFSNEVLKDIKKTYEESYNSEPSRRVSAYAYRLVEPMRWHPFTKVF